MTPVSLYLDTLRGSFIDNEQIGATLRDFAELNGITVRFHQSLKEPRYMRIDVFGEDAHVVAAKMIVSGLYMAEDKLPCPSNEMSFLLIFDMNFGSAPADDDPRNQFPNWNQTAISIRIAPCLRTSAPGSIWVPPPSG